MIATLVQSWLNCNPNHCFIKALDSHCLFLSIVVRLDIYQVFIESWNYLQTFSLRKAKSEVKCKQIFQSFSSGFNLTAFFPFVFKVLLISRLTKQRKQRNFKKWQIHLRLLWLRIYLHYLSLSISLFGKLHSAFELCFNKMKTWALCQKWLKIHSVKF